MSFINAKIFPGSRERSITKEEDGSFEIRVTTFPEKGKANKSAIDMIAKFLKISSSRIKIIKGSRRKKKLFSIND